VKPTVIVLGEDARRALGLEKLLLHPQMCGSVAYRYVPSCNPEIRALIDGLILELFYE
jgi:hypothetical protein